MVLHHRILLGLILGAICGVLVNIAAGEALWVDALNSYVAGPVGQIFLRLLMMVVVPLVFATLALGVARLGDLGKIGRLGARTLVYFLLTTTLAVGLGLFLANSVEPGAGITPETAAELLDTYRGQANLRLEASAARDFGIDTFVNIVPRNPVQAAADMQMLPLIFFSLMFGIALTMIPAAKARGMMDFLEGLAGVVTKLIELAMKLAPYGVFALIFVVTSRFGWNVLGTLGLYAATVLLGLAIHAAVTLSLLLRFAAGIRPRRFWGHVREAVITAFSTSSSNATLPTSLLVAERNLGVPPQVAGFVLPLGATMNMNGTALFEGITMLFVAQVFGVDLTLSQQLVVVILSILTAVGAAGVPGGSIPLLMVLAASVGIPGEGIAIIIGIDRILDMARTVVNVSGDLTATCVVARYEGVWDAQRADPSGHAPVALEAKDDV